MLREILKKQMQKGLEVEVSDIDVQDLLLEMEKETVDRKVFRPQKSSCYQRKRRMVRAHR